MLGNKSMLVVSLSCSLIFKMCKKKKTTKQNKKNRVQNAGAFFLNFLYGSIATSGPYTDKYLLTQMIKATIPGA